MSLDTGNHIVNVEDSILSGKVNFRNQDFVLLLQPDSLVFREFATDDKGFTVTIDQILTIYLSSKTPKEFTFEAIIPRSQNDPTRVQATFQIKCPSSEEAEEWVENVRSVITDKQLRDMKKDEEQSARIENQKIENLMELKGMFPDIDDEIIRTIYNSNGGNMDSSINSLLSISDPNFVPQQNTDQSVEEQMKLDEQLAIMLQDELFIEQLKKDGEIQKDLKGAQEKDEISVITSKIQEMSFATKKKFMEYYNKLKNGDRDDSVGEELKPLQPGVNRDYDDDYQEEEEEKLVPERRSESKNLQYSPAPRQATQSSPAKKPEPKLIDLDDDGL